MQYDAKTPPEYIETLDDDWRKEKLLKLRAIIQSKAPNLIEEISYKMLGYRDERGLIFHLNAQKNFVGFYVGNAHKIDPDGSLLKGIDVGKGCIRFKKSLSVEDTRIDEFIEHTMDLWKSGEDIDC